MLVLLCINTILLYDVIYSKININRKTYTTTHCYVPLVVKAALCTVGITFPEYTEVWGIQQQKQNLEQANNYGIRKILLHVSL